MTWLMATSYEVFVTDVNETFVFLLCSASAMNEPHERLKHAREKAGLKNARQAAEALGVVYSTYAGHENGSVKIPRDRAVHYAQRFRVTVDWLLTGKESAALPVETVAHTLPLIGEVQAGAWKEAAMYEAERQEPILTPASDIVSGARQFWLRIVGDSVNKIIPDGGHALCISTFDWARDSEDLFRRANGKLVVVERERAGMHELTIKRLVVDGDAAELHSVSDNPRHQGAISLTETSEDEVRIIAVVTRAMIDL